MWRADWRTLTRPRRAVHAVLGGAAVRVGVFEGRRCLGQADCPLEANAVIDGAAGAPAELAALEHALSCALADVQAAAGASRPGRAVDVHVVVADRWLRGAVVPWHAALARSDAEQASCLRRELQARGCDVAPGDVVRADDALAGRPRRAVLYPAGLIALASKSVERAGLHLASMQPLSERGRAFLGSCRPDALAVVDGSDLVFATLRHRRLDTVTTCNGADAAAIGRLWNRMLWRNPSPARASTLVVVNLEPGRLALDALADAQLMVPAASPSGVPCAPALALAAQTAKRGRGLDAVRPSGTHRLGVVLAALAVGAAAVCALQASQSRRQLDSGLAQLASRSQPARAARPSAPLTKAERARDQAMNAAVLEINAPVGTLLSSLKPPHDIDVQVISTEWESAPSRSGAHAMSIVAETRTATDMERYAGFVASRPGFTSATLVTHDLSDTGSLYRFNVEATWTQ